MAMHAKMKKNGKTHDVPWIALVDITCKGSKPTNNITSRVTSKEG